MWVCETCRGSDLAQDAWVDPNDNCSVISTYDKFWCGDCDGEATVIEIKED